jgi:catechol 2,3-dioxygenase
MKTTVLQKLSGPEVFRLSDETYISRVHLRTPDLRRALDFYQRVIGFKVLERSKDEASVSATGSPPGFLAFTEDRNAAPRRPRTTGLYHFAIRYPTRRDLANALRRIIAADHPIDGGSDHDFGYSIYLQDLDGNGVELYFDLPRSEWPIRNGLIVVHKNEPLDFDNLLGVAASDSVPAHAAAGTDIGHLNLHVADLAEGEKFFRDFLGLEITAHLGPNGRFLAAGGYHHHVAINTWAGKNPAPENSVGLISYRFAVPDVRVLSELRERADRFGYGAQMAGDVLQILDPNGHWLEVETPGNSKLVVL